MLADRTLKRIDEIIKVVNTHPEYSACVSKRKYDALQREAKKHSIAIEIGEGENGEKERTLLSRMTDAETYLAQNEITLATLSCLGHLIDPVKNPQKRFRIVDSYNPNEVLETVRGDELVAEPPMASEVPSQIKNLILFLNESKTHPVVRNAEAHLEIARIHPYFDGNGRAARLIGNVCLDQRGYPAAVIPESERRLYKRIIQDALMSRTKEKTSVYTPSREEETFYEYIATKVLDSVNELQKELEENRAFEIQFKGRYEPGAVISFSKRIRNSSSAQGRQVKVLKKKNNGGSKGTYLHVIGNIGEREIRVVADDLSRRSRNQISYDIKRLGCPNA